MAAILLSRMEVGYCTSRCFHSYARQAILLSVCCLACVVLNLVHIQVIAFKTLSKDNLRMTMPNLEV